eukprot:scaffold117600_cov50-Attheya_sp.AAC.1
MVLRCPPDVLIPDHDDHYPHVLTQKSSDVCALCARKDDTTSYKEMTFAFWSPGRSAFSV